MVSREASQAQGMIQVAVVLPRLTLSQGLLEGRALEFAESHAAVWKTFIIKPGGIVAKNMASGGWTGMFTSMGALLGENWSVRIDELAIFMTYLAVDGKGEDSLIENARIARKGRELLESQKDKSAKM